MPESPAPAPPSSRSPGEDHVPLFTRDFILLCVATFLFAGSMFLLFAVLPVFVVDELNGADSQVGLIMGAFAVSALLARPMTGHLVDAWSRKTVLGFGALVYAVAPALYTQAETVPIMLGLRVFHGLGIAAYTTAAGVIVADIAPARRRGEGMGYYGMALNLAMTVGPALGVMLMEQISYTWLFWLCAALGLGSLVLSQLIREPTRPPGVRPPDAVRRRWVSRSALFPGFIAVCMTVPFGAVVSFLPLFAKAHGLGNPGVYFTIYSLVVVISRPLAGRLSDRFGRPAVIVPGMLCLTAAMLTLAGTVSTQGMLAAAVLKGLGFGVVQPAIMALAVDRTAPHERGLELATLMGAFDVGVGLSSIVLGVVLDHTNFTVMFLCAGGVALCGGLGTVWGNRSKPAAQRTPPSDVAGPNLRR